LIRRRECEGYKEQEGRRKKEIEIAKENEIRM
jgi:hypothetical protein